MVQQKQGRVKPTLRMKGAAINDDSVLEREADDKGARAQADGRESTGALRSGRPAVAAASSPVVQRKINILYGDCAGVYTKDNLVNLLGKIAVAMKAGGHKNPKRGVPTLVNSEQTYTFDNIEAILTYMNDDKAPDLVAEAKDTKATENPQAKGLFDAGMADSSGVSDENAKGTVVAHLDNDQLKHQPIAPKQVNVGGKKAGDIKDVKVLSEEEEKAAAAANTYRIGTREKVGGNKFKPPAGSVAWHKTNTLAHMLKWGEELKGLQEGVKKEHGQAKPVHDVHYEGYCVLFSGKRYVFFHCYPADKSKLLL